MPNVFQKLSAQIRALKEENEDLKRNSNGGKSYIKELFQMTIKNMKLKNENEELKETIERMNADLNALSNLMDAPPKYEEVVSNPLKIQALMRGFLTRKNTNAKCCVCYDMCFIKNTCCNSFLCGECRPRCNGKCPICRTRFPNHPNDGLFDLLIDSDSEDEEDEITELILNPTHQTGDLRLYNQNPQLNPNVFRFWIQLSPNIINNEHLRNQYRNLTYHDVPNTHRMEFTRNWINQTLGFLDAFRMIDLNRMRNGEVDRYRQRFSGFMFGENVSLTFVENFSGARSFLENIVDMPSHWTNEQHSPQVYRINEEGEAYQYSHNNTGRLGSARGFPRDIGDEYLGQTGEAKARRGVHTIMNQYCEIKHIAGMEFKGAIVKYHDKYECIIQYSRNTNLI